MNQMVTQYLSDSPFLDSLRLLFASREESNPSHFRSKNEFFMNFIERHYNKYERKYRNEIKLIWKEIVKDYDAKNYDDQKTGRQWAGVDGGR